MTYLYSDGDIRRRIRVEDFFISLKNTFSFTEENSRYVRISSTSFNELVDTFAKLILSNEVVTIYKRQDDVFWKITYLINNFYVTLSGKNDIFVYFIDLDNPFKEEPLNEVVSEEEKKRVYGCILNMFLIKDE
jgi:hypothetical protein